MNPLPRSPLSLPTWTAAAIARRVRDEAMLRAVRRNHNPRIQLPAWLREARP